MNTTPVSPRRAAKESLVAVLRHGRYSNLEVDSVVSRQAFESPEDRALYTRLVYGVIERLITLDYVISSISSHDISSIDIETLISLRLGFYQLIYTDRIPDHAAVSETVSVAPLRSRGFVNACLRTFIRKGRTISVPDGKAPEEMSVRYSVSADICRILIDSYGSADAEAILNAANHQNGITLRINTTRLTVNEAKHLLTDLPSDVSYGNYASDVLRVPSLTEGVRSGIERGDWFVQDESSRIATMVTGALNGEMIADVCAAPGGKTFSLAMDSAPDGRIYSFDIHKNKLSLIESGASRLGLSGITCSMRDGRNPDPVLIGTCDRVLCDAPCSGIGVIGKKPELRLRQSDDVQRLPEIQYAILCGASEYVKPGGVLVYSTCTLNRRENEDTVRRFLDAHSEFSPSDFTVKSMVGGHDILSDNGKVTLFPHLTGTDGFFIARMVKKSVINTSGGESHKA